MAVLVLRHVQNDIVAVELRIECAAGPMPETCNHKILRHFTADFSIFPDAGCCQVLLGKGKSALDRRLMSFNQATIACYFRHDRYGLRCAKG